MNRLSTDIINLVSDMSLSTSDKAEAISVACDDVAAQIATEIANELGEDDVASLAFTIIGARL